jgi:hypothetical protein
MFRSILSYKSEFNDNFNLFRNKNSRVQAYKKESRIQNFKDIIQLKKKSFLFKNHFMCQNQFTSLKSILFHLKV